MLLSSLHSLLHLCTPEKESCEAKVLDIEYLQSRLVADQITPRLSALASICRFSR